MAQPVPEPKTVKHRVHLDVHVAAVADLVALGATVRGDSQPWTDLADPEGGELCAFVRDPARLTDYRLYEVVVDSADPAAIATWWADRFGVAVEHGDGHRRRGVLLAWRVRRDRRSRWCSAKVPEPKTVKNRLHWDVRGEVDELLAAGARLLRDARRRHRAGTSWPTRRATSSASSPGNEPRDRHRGLA